MHVRVHIYVLPIHFSMKALRILDGVTAVEIFSGCTVNASGHLPAWT